MSELETKKQNHDLLDAALSAMSKLLSRWAVKNRLEGEDKNGVVVYYNNKTIGLLMFHFVTIDDLHIELEFDLNRLRAEGNDYMLTLVEIILTQLEAAREEKQKNESIVLLPERVQPINIGKAVKDALRTYH